MRLLFVILLTGMVTYCYEHKNDCDIQTVCFEHGKIVSRSIEYTCGGERL